MKKLQLFSLYLLVISTFLISSDTYGQTRTPVKYYYYAEVRITANTSTITEGELTVFVDFGKDYYTSSMQPKALQMLATKIKTFKNGVDIQNCMSDEGWEYVDKQVQHESTQIKGNTMTVFTNYIFMNYTFRKVKE